MDISCRRANRIINHLSGTSDQNCVQNPTSAFPGGLLKDQVAIITGSGQGIGEAAAHLFAKEGAKVVVTDIDQGKSDKVAAAIVEEGGSAVSFPGDVTEPSFPGKIIEHTIKVFGKINIIVNNAGYTYDGILHKITDKQWNAMLEVHNTAPFRMVRAATPYMRELAKTEKEKGQPNEPRCILNVSSTSGLHGNIGQANYSTAKAGVLGFTKTVAKEWGPFGIRCNAIAFGLIDTRLTRDKSDEAIQVGNQKVQLGMPPGTNKTRDYKFIPLQRGGTPEDAARAMLFLCSPLASYVTGHCLEVTGGVGI